jgi:hypothetical protein
VPSRIRRTDAIESGIDAFVCFQDFTDEDDAMDYAIANQRDRRNLTDAELAGLVIVVDKRRVQGGDRHSETFKASPDALNGKSSHVTAELTGTSPKKVEKIRAIADYAEKTGDHEEKDAVLNGKTSINAADRQVAAIGECNFSELPHP